MRVSIHHTSTYRYSRAVAFNPHRLMLRPRAELGLDVLSHSLAISPTPGLVWSTDVFGNCIATATFAGAATELVIESRSLVEATSPDWPVYAIEPRAQQHPFRYTQDEALDLGGLFDTRVDPRVASWARGFVASARTDALSLLKDVNAGILADISYAARDGEGTQAPVETLRVASGSCRDLAALFIECARSLGFAARAVSGYAFDPTAPEAVADTTHAWAEVFLPGAGWVAFDPTHARMGGYGLIPVAVGRCNAQILPLTGSYVGGGGGFRRNGRDGPCRRAGGAGGPR